MDKEKLIKRLYKILLIFEDTQRNNASVNFDDYLRYLDRQYIWWTGYGNQEIASTIKGLQLLSTNINHAQVKTNVFNMINILEKELECHGV